LEKKLTLLARHEEAEKKLQRCRI